MPAEPPAAKHQNRRTRTVAVIPARLASTRLPGKVLRPILGIPMLGWVYRAARACPQLDEVLIATDSNEVAAYAASEGWPCRMTSSALASGTDRVREVARQVDADIYVNLQGDEPLLERGHIEALLRPFENPNAAVTTLAIPCLPGEIANPNAVKVVCGADGRALYFSRAAIPFDRDRGEGVEYRKHLGLYAFRKAALERFAALPVGRLEAAERLEQLRFLENGIPIYVEEAPRGTIGVDTEDDLRAAEAVLRSRLG